MQSRLLPFLSSAPHAGLVHRGRSLLGLLVFNSGVGLIFWATRRNEVLLPYLVVANGIGFSATLLSVAADKLVRGKLALVPKILIVAPASVFIGFEIAASTIGHVPHLIGHAGVKVWLAYGSSFVVAGAACAFVSVSVQAARMRASLETQRREAAEARQAETAARLALLQAQIEPHFLFNTLANVQSLIERDPARATTMLDSLNCYLRASLSRTREATSTLEEELELVEALLKIATIRLGEARLRYAIDVPAALRALPLSPLLLQPLVENALLHGIEPSVDGGEVRIRGTCDSDLLVLSVSDTGVGLGNGGTKLHGGVGLANVRARMISLYGERGRVSVGANADAMRGVTATLQIPIA
ncbi:sensor histidine kinase [Burkholderia stagnalis]|uniref:sensor histidine kinase n=1 Tax=Burkholderia stagnalis TaxID=1503054 RepID=UPI000F598802|nr:histidine kinase [Burkholderia stagnalis]RQQ35645.1 histidine kinase [Burkholderia stagnalis]RQY27536.1 histidine kinase [Burkholderia stagnalis]RQY60666.1 histidine kinase [Burkholderia stagnalis]RQZ02377.1 histidine kinase [Burkholderia stagnalis]RQZ08388.1 histidine kinase [Burkholderia stagnalis]